MGLVHQLECFRLSFGNPRWYVPTMLLDYQLEVRVCVSACVLFFFFNFYLIGKLLRLFAMGFVIFDDEVDANCCLGFYRI